MRRRRLFDLKSGDVVRDEPGRPGYAGWVDRYVIISSVLVLIDVCVLFIGRVPIADIILPRDMQHADVWRRIYDVVLLVCLCSWFAVHGHYTTRRSLSCEVLQVAVGVLVVSFMEWSLQFGGHHDFWNVVAVWIMALLIIMAGRFVTKWTLFQLGPWRLATVIVGPAIRCAAISGMLVDDWYRGFVVRAKIHSDGSGPCELEFKLGQLVKFGHVRHVLIAGDGGSRDVVAGAVARVLRRRRDVTVGIVPLVSGIPFSNLLIDSSLGNGLRLPLQTRLALPRLRAWSKRCLDVFVSLALLLLALPIMALIASLIRRDGGPVFYRSSRLGRGGKLFSALKFRTMAPDADRVLRDLLDRDPNSRIEWEAGFKLRQDPRVTAIGRVLRKLSLDELPQLINVLMGDMSLVGPRPLLPAERAVYGEAFNLYCQCLPGITGLWQVSGRNNLDYLRRIELNTWYAKNATFWIDIVILCRTLSVVIRRVGAV